jgi:hypothetical protein
MGTRHPQWLAVLMIFASIAASAVFGWHLQSGRTIPARHTSIPGSCSSAVSAASSFQVGRPARNPATAAPAVSTTPHAMSTTTRRSGQWRSVAKLVSSQSPVMRWIRRKATG